MSAGDRPALDRIVDQLVENCPADIPADLEFLDVATRYLLANNVAVKLLTDDHKPRARKWAVQLSLTEPNLKLVGIEDGWQYRLTRARTFAAVADFAAALREYRAAASEGLDPNIFRAEAAKVTARLSSVTPPDQWGEPAFARDHGSAA